MASKSPETSEQHDRNFSDFQSPHEASVDRLVQALDRAYHNPWLMMWRSFLHGLMAAIGATTGTFLILILSGVIIQALGGLSLLDPLLDKLQDTINQTSIGRNASSSASSNQ